MAQAICRRLLTAEDSVESQASACRICGVKTALGQVHLRVLRFSPVFIILPPLHSHLAPTLHNLSNTALRTVTRMLDIARWIYSAVTSVKLQHKNRIYLTLQKNDRLKRKVNPAFERREFLYSCRSTFFLSLCRLQRRIHTYHAVPMPFPCHVKS
jgi:hypothetical protein